jgi:hypothetical protein
MMGKGINQAGNQSRLHGRFGMVLVRVFESGGWREVGGVVVE